MNRVASGGIRFAWGCSAFFGIGGRIKRISTRGPRAAAKWVDWRFEFRSRFISFHEVYRIMADKKSKISNKKLTPKDVDLAKDSVMPGEVMTTNQGLKLTDDQNSLKAGVRGPTLLEDFHFREKITHFDHERIPERVVHARGAAAHGYFQPYKSLTEYTKASLFADPKKQTPVFVRFSTVAGSRGSPDTPRDVRGFAIKFYTDDGVWDMVGNNIPVFFIQDAIKFPDLIHAVKPEPHNEIPQAASAHDTFYDFISLTPEAMHMIMWVMSDRALPRQFATMQGFGIHTFRLVNAQGKSRFCKIHFKPIKGLQSMCWDESAKLMGKDADFHRRNMWEAIERGDFPEWEMGLQIVEEKDEHAFDFDLLDATKIIPEELVPVMPIGKLVLNRNPDNYFAETEQVAFHPGHVVPGIDFSNDPLLQGRLFSYFDTQIKRVGPNFAQIPINRPTCPVHNNQRDGESQQAIPKGRVAYFPNSLAKGCPMHTPEGVQAFSSYAEKIDGNKVRVRSPSFGDHFSQATLFWNSCAAWEKTHIVDALSFELNMCEIVEIKARFVNELLANVADELAMRVAKNAAVDFKPVKKKPLPKSGKKGVSRSPLLSMDKPAPGIKGMKVAILAADGADAKAINTLKSKLLAQGALADVIAAAGGFIKGSDGSAIQVVKPAVNVGSVLYDAVFIPDGVAETLKKHGLSLAFIAEAYKHGKAIAASGDGLGVIEKANVPTESVDGSMGLVAVGDGKAMNSSFETFFTAMKKRHFTRDVSMIPA
jgi:catalase